MKWKDKEIKNLSDDKLREAIHSVGNMDGFRYDKLASKRKRHEKIFEKHPATENPVFTQLVDELNQAFQLRQLKEI